jgi:hypothetical protein
MEKKRTYKKSKQKSAEAKEPLSPYLVFSNSFEEMETASYLHWLKLTPEQRIAEATFLIHKLFAGKINKKNKNQRIIFDSYE